MGNLDLRAAGSHPIRLADTRRGLTCVRYNHKPDLSEDLATATLRQDTKKGDYKLSIKDDEDEYVYQGGVGDAQDTVLLLLDESGDGVVLETADASIACNLVGAPWESDAKKLAEQYPILRAVEGEQSGAIDSGSLDTSDESDRDPKNPFDFRNYLDAFTTTTATTKVHNAGRSSPAVSNASTPRKDPPARAVRKPANPMLPNQRKAKPRASAAAATTRVSAPKRTKSPPPLASVSVPEVRVSSSTAPNAIRKGKANVDDIELDLDIDDPHDDDGDLVLDDAPPKPSKHNAHLRAAAESTGPISLRSAASSPASRVASPAAAGGYYRQPPSAQHHDDDDLVLDHGPTHRERTQDYDSEDDHAETAPPPARNYQAAQQRRRSSGIAPAEAAEDDDEELAQAMLRELEEDDYDDDEQQTAGAQPNRYVEEEEESEEE
ncbi:hypothetical protein K461DRAFT_292803 [Myriangium duriaei CBS 260.36]|uniref:Transcription elongation factor Eaf N-terminal domain-containing protein n=1 Tax=Myriangium duriaei CBS 260.36 TaxID=1168546 RepID=A0A9P4J286_9PEZI|nr:hypothetical protein K461DRAFT_292803 [Myriangium duriaei CBS 260.36]